MSSSVFLLFSSGSLWKLWTPRSPWSPWPWHWHVRLCWSGSDGKVPWSSQVHEGRPGVRKPPSARCRGRRHAQISQQPDREHPQPGGIQEEPVSHLQRPQALPSWLEERWVTARDICQMGGRWWSRHQLSDILPWQLTFCGVKMLVKYC